MRTLLISPEFPYSFWSCPKTCQLKGHKAVNPPLGLLTVAALLPSEWEMRLVDLTTSQLKDKDWHWADLVMISAMRIQKEGLLALVKEAKAKGKTVVTGGPFPTIFPQEALEAGCDFVVRGEGENTIPFLLEALKDGKSQVIENNVKPELTASPIPRFDLLRLGDYQSITVQTSRGCPYNCEFCDVINLYGRRPRYKTPKQVRAELETLYRLGARGSVFVVDDNFIGSRKHAQDLLQELIPWLKSRGKPFDFITQAPVNLGHDQEMINLMSAANFERVVIGIESPDENVLRACQKYHNIGHPLTESLHNLKRQGMEVIGTFIIGFDGESQGAGERICMFIEQNSIPIAMLNLLQAPPHTGLWNRLEREGRLRSNIELVGEGNFSELNYEPDRPEAEILREYIDAWDYLYEPSRFFRRAFHYHLAMSPVHQTNLDVAESSLPRKHVSNQGITWRSKLTGITALFRILWWQGVQASYRRQFWTQLIGILRENPTRFKMYLRTCASGLDLIPMRSMVRERIRAIMKERKIETPLAQS